MKVAYFDYWTRGISNFLPLEAELKKLGHTTILIHIGSFRGLCPLEETINGILVRDINYYKTQFIYEMLKIERPDVIVSLNTTYILDRAMVLAAKNLGIKTVYLMHGNKAWHEQTEDRLNIARDSFNPFFKKIAKAGKYLTSVIPNYFYSFYRSPFKDAWWRPFAVLWAYFKDPALAFYFPPYPDGVLHDKCLVYAEGDVEHFQKIGYSREAIHVVGNPRLDRLLLRQKNNDFPLDRLPQPVAEFVRNKTPYVVIIEDSFPESGNAAGWTNTDRNLYIEQLGKTMQQKGFRLVVKVHPSSNLENFNVQDPSILLYQDASLDDLLYHCVFCVTHFSTAVNQAVLLNKPVLQPRWGKSANTIDYHVRRGVSIAWHNPLELPEIELNKAAYESYKKIYISILTPVSAQSTVQQILHWTRP